MAVIAIPHCEPWVVNRWAFRTLLERTAFLTDDSSDVDALRRAIALDGLHFDLMPPQQGERMARAIERAADALRQEYRETGDEYERGFADRLDVLRLHLSDLTGW